MAERLRFKYGTELEILSMTPSHPAWEEKAFYYPSDKTYFYQVFNGVLRKYAGGDVSIVGTGITLNGKVIGGVKSLIERSDVLQIPENYEYNIYSLDIEGIINNDGIINMI